MQNDQFEEEWALDLEITVGRGETAVGARGGFKVPQPLSLAAVQNGSLPLSETAV